MGHMTTPGQPGAPGMGEMGEGLYKQAYRISNTLKNRLHSTSPRAMKYIQS